MKTLLFYRDFRRFTGGHLKVWHYFRHCARSPSYRPRIAFSPASRWDETNPWLPYRDLALPQWDPTAGEAYFLAGMDWQVLDREQCRAPPRPVINFIQHVRHADPREDLYPFLAYPAVRLCVSAPVTAALRASGRVNGPLFTIPNGLDGGELPPVIPWAERPLDLLILGLKQPDLARELASRLAWPQASRLAVLVKPLPRKDFLARLAQARVALLLPNHTEGFYLPALEGFALETLVICPDVIGNRPFCQPGINCLMPEYTSADLLEAVALALSLTADARRSMIAAAGETARAHDVQREGDAFLAILEGLEDIWRQAFPSLCPG